MTSRSVWKLADLVRDSNLGNILLCTLSRSTDHSWCVGDERGKTVALTPKRIGLTRTAPIRRGQTREIGPKRTNT